MRSEKNLAHFFLLLSLEHVFFPLPTCLGTLNYRLRLVAIFDRSRKGTGNATIYRCFTKAYPAHKFPTRVSGPYQRTKRCEGQWDRACMLWGLKFPGTEYGPQAIGLRQEALVSAYPENILSIVLIKKQSSLTPKCFENTGRNITTENCHDFNLLLTKL